MSSSKPASSLFSLPVAEFHYRQMVRPLEESAPATSEEASVENEGPSIEETMRLRVAVERASAIAETEARLRAEFEQRANRESTRISQAIEAFQQSRREYFSKVEGEVVQLALAIARKILHREAQVDPLLIGAIVQIALGQLKEGSAVTLRVRPEDAPRWREYFVAQALNLTISVVEDAELAPQDCVLDTELGSVNYSVDVQLKEVEMGFLDVLAQRPQL